MHDADKRGSKPVVLVVEDDYWQRVHAVDVIERAGYDVVEANSADEAIKLLETRKDIAYRFHRHRDARLDGRPQARSRHSRSLAAS